MKQSLTINGAQFEVDSADLAPLLTVLRDQLGLRGTKLGCGEGRCGSCTVLVNDKPVASCLYPVALARGADVRTIESLSGPDEPLNSLQDLFVEHGAVQCGACIPGVLMSLSAFLKDEESPTEQGVRRALAGNICRCTGYSQIVDAALALAEQSPGTA